MYQIRYLIIFLALAALKVLAMIFYRCELTWVGTAPQRPFENLRVVCLLNHTSLFEPLFIAIVPWSVVWQMSRRAVLPAADITLERPFVGKIVRFLAPKVVSITRKRDASWQNFLNQISKDSQIWMAPEGRMMRENGLDKHGEPITIRGGIADVLNGIHQGQIVLAYSGGLHHVQKPGDGFPKLFKKIHINLEQLSIEEFKKQVLSDSDRGRFKLAVIENLENRKRNYVPEPAI